MFHCFAEAIWHLVSSEVRKHNVVYELEPNVKYSQIEFILYLSRKPLYYVVNIVIPCCLLIIISLLVSALQHRLFSRPLTSSLWYDVSSVVCPSVTHVLWIKGTGKLVTRLIFPVSWLFACKISAIQWKKNFKF